MKGLDEFVYNNMAGMLPQALYTLCTYMETVGIFVIDRLHRSIVRDMTSVIAKDGSGGACGDAYV